MAANAARESHPGIFFSIAIGQGQQEQVLLQPGVGVQAGGAPSIRQVRYTLDAEAEQNETVPVCKQ
jgi:hypothetical protein